MQIRQKTHSEMIATLRKVGQPKCHYDLRNADLRNADLRCVNLQDTDLWVFRTTKHTAIYVPWQKLLKIGCLEYPIEKWQTEYKSIGKLHDFSEKEIKQYGQFIKLCAEALR